MGSGRKLVSNSFYLFLDWFVLILVGVVYTVIITKFFLKPAEYGIVNTSINLATFLSAISIFGLTSTAWKLIPEYLVKKQEGKAISLMRFSLKLIAISNTVILITFLIMPNFISKTTNLPLDVIALTGITAFLNSFALQSNSIICGFQRMKKLFLIDFLGAMAKVATSIVLLILGFRYIGPISGTIVWLATGTLLRFLSVPFRGKTEKIDGRHILKNYAFPAFIGIMVLGLFQSGQYILLTALQNPKETGIYSLVMVMVTPIVVIPTNLGAGLFPMISELSVSRKMHSQRSRLISLVFRYSLFLMLPITLFMIIFSKQIVLIFSNAEYLAASSLFPIIAISSVLYGLGSMFLSNLYAIGKTKLNRNITIVTTIVLFVLAVPLVEMFASFGLAISYFVSVAVLYFVSHFYLKKYVKMKLPWNDTFKLAMSGLLSLFVVYLFSTLVKGLIIDFVLVAIGVVIYLLALVPLRFYNEEDVKLLNIVSEKFPRLKKHVDFVVGLIN